MGAKVKINSTDVKEISRASVRINGAVKKILFAKTRINGAIKKIILEALTKVKMFGENSDDNSQTAIEVDGKWMKKLNIDRGYKKGTVIKTRSSISGDSAGTGGEIFLNGENVALRIPGGSLSKYDYQVGDNSASISLLNYCIFIEDKGDAGWGTFLGTGGSSDYIIPGPATSKVYGGGAKFPLRKGMGIRISNNIYGKIYLNGTVISTYGYTYVSTGTNALFEIKDGDPNFYIVEDEIITIPVTVRGSGSEEYGYIKDQRGKKIVSATVLQSRYGDIIQAYAREDPYDRDGGNISYNYELIRKDAYGSSSKEITIYGPVDVFLDGNTVWIADKEFKTYKLTLIGSRTRTHTCYVSCVATYYYGEAELDLIAGISLSFAVPYGDEIIVNGSSSGRSFDLNMPNKDVTVIMHNQYDNMEITY